MDGYAKASKEGSRLLTLGKKFPHLIIIGCGAQLLDFAFTVSDAPTPDELHGGYKSSVLTTSILGALREFEGRMYNSGYPSIRESFRLVLFCRQWAGLQAKHPLDQLMNAIDITGIDRTLCQYVHKTSRLIFLPASSRGYRSSGLDGCSQGDL